MPRVESLADVRRSIESAYRARTPKSRALHDRALQSLPGGESRTATWFRPYPTYIASGSGTTLTDVDGNRLVDFTFNSTAVVHGHAHPDIVAAVQRRVAEGTAWNAPNAGQVELAEILCARVPGLDRVRFCASGTEANMQAIKAARAFTDRDLIVKMDQAYHGTYEGVEIHKGPSGWGGAGAPVSRGVPRNAMDNVLIAPFDDAEIVEWLLESHPGQVAAIVVNPAQTQGGLRAPSPGYLGALRDTAHAHGALLVFDEVITLRLAPGGGQELFGVVPDLTAMGKIIGGGLPVGGFGGRADIMEMFADRQPPLLPHAGTFNGNPATMAAGIAAMQLLDAPAFERLAQLGADLGESIVDASRQAGVALHVTQIESLLGVDLPQAGASSGEILDLIALDLLNRGFKAASMMTVSTATAAREIRALADALGDVLRELRPVIAQVAPAAMREPERVA